MSMHIPVEIAQGGQETQIDDETNEAPCADEEGAEIEVKLGVDLINYTYQGTLLRIMEPPMSVLHVLGFGI